ncbi:MAG: hypothetical protein IJ154_06350 [Bacteroidales bacterium]|nr:hypothetical protein [Bacteroidales bacterium]
MKKTISLLLRRSLPAVILLTGLVSCRPDRSHELMNRAREAMAQNRFQLAKSYLDTLQDLYPSDLVKLQAVRGLFFQVEYAEQEHSLRGIDSLLALRQAESLAPLKDFSLEKDSETDAHGHYVHIRQRYAQRSGQNWLQSTVALNGRLIITSYYCGTRSLGHSRLRVYAPDNSYAETAEVQPDGALNYSFSDNGQYYETVLFNAKAVGDLPDFVRLHSAESLRVTLLGDGRPLEYALRAEDRDILLKAAELSVIMTDINRLEDEKRLALAKMEFLAGKMKNPNAPE